MTSQNDQLRQWLGEGSINVFGRPFSGKDTQAKHLAEIFKTSVIGGGEILRQSQNSNVKKIISGGELAPQQAYLDIVLPYFKQPKFDGKPLILNSIGRWHGEESAVVRGLETSGHPLKAVVTLNIDESEVKKRWQTAKELGDRGRRADDAHATLDVRLEEFRNKTIPVIEYYRQQGVLMEVDGSQKTEKVTKDILGQLLKIASGN